MPTQGDGPLFFLRLSNVTRNFDFYAGNQNNKTQKKPLAIHVTSPVGSVTDSGNVSLDPGCRDRSSSDNPKFIVKRQLKRYPAGKAKTGAGGVAGGGTGESCGPGVVHWRGTGERIHNV